MKYSRYISNWYTGLFAKKYRFDEGQGIGALL